MLVALQLVGVAAVPLKVTVLVPCVDPKFVPLIVTEVPTGPEVGEKPVMLGAAEDIAKLPPSVIATPTATLPLAAVSPTGTDFLMPVVLQRVAVSAAPWT